MSAAGAVRVAIAAVVLGSTAAAVVVALNESGRGDVGRHVLITAPAAGTEVALDEELSVTAQGFDPGGVHRWEVLAAGEVVAEDDPGPDGPTHVPIEVTFRPQAPGPLLIEVRVVGPDGRERPSGSVQVTVLERGAETTSTTNRGRRTTTTSDQDDRSRPETATTLDSASTTGTTVTRPTTTATTAPTTSAPATTATSAPTTTSSTTTTLPDTTPPRVSASHAPTQPTPNDRVTFTVTAADDRDIARVEVWIQGPGENQASLAAACASSPCSHVHDPFPEGATVTYFGIARDSAGNEGRSTVRSFRSASIIR